MHAHSHNNGMGTKKVLLLRADLARVMGRDVRNAQLNEIEPVAWLKTGATLAPLYDFGAIKLDPAAGFKNLQESHKMERVSLARELEARYGKNWQKPFNYNTNRRH